MTMRWLLLLFLAACNTVEGAPIDDEDAGAASAADAADEADAAEVDAAAD